jgi:hypothetical protein
VLLALSVPFISFTSAQTSCPIAGRPLCREAVRILLQKPFPGKRLRSTTDLPGLPNPGRSISQFVLSPLRLSVRPFCAIISAPQWMAVHLPGSLAQNSILLRCSRIRWIPCAFSSAASGEVGFRTTVIARAGSGAPAGAERRSRTGFEQWENRWKGDNLCFERC